MVQRQWWQRPQLRLDEDGESERRVTWLELFYDLVFVAVVSELTHYLSHHVSPAGVLAYVLLFVPVWWVWIGGSFYNARFETDDVSYRLFTFAQMLPVAAMAIFVHDGVGETSAQFALAYAAARVLITIMWLRGGQHAPLMRPVTNRYGIGFSLSIALFVVSVFVPPPLRFVLWGMGLLIDLLTPITTLHLQARIPRLSNSKLPERFGLLVILVLGEAVVGTVRGVAAGIELTPLVGLSGALGMALAFGLWWVYFDFVSRRRPRPNVWSAFVWNYLHLPLLMGIGAIGAGVSNALTLGGAAHDVPDHRLIASALALALLAIGLLELTLHREDDEPTDTRISVVLKVAAAMIALALGAWGVSLSSPTFLMTLLLLLLVQIGYGAYAWFRPVADGEEAGLSSNVEDTLAPPNITESSG